MQSSVGGIVFRGAVAVVASARQQFEQHLAELGLVHYVTVVEVAENGLALARFQLTPRLQQQWAPDCDTMQICRHLGLDTAKDADLECEIILSMLCSPIGFEYPAYAELQSAIRIRRNIVQAGRRTSLNFRTEDADRPTDCWTYSEDTGFTVLPGVSLITALEKATQPLLSGCRYAFSCYRATEYVILLGIAQELAGCNPALYGRLQRQWEEQAIMSGRFHEVFLREYGSLEQPMPMLYYVPGDRVWFRNPDSRSSDATGYEGSWVIYLGNGLFTNFWDSGAPYTLADKCIEIYHWRHGVYTDAAGEVCIDEDVVSQHVQATQARPDQAEEILQQMLRFREPQGVYENGGCMDTSRECARWVQPETADLGLPQAEELLRVH